MGFLWIYIYILVDMIYYIYVFVFITFVIVFVFFIIIIIIIMHSCKCMKCVTFKVVCSRVGGVRAIKWLQKVIRAVRDRRWRRGLDRPWTAREFVTLGKYYLCSVFAQVRLCSFAWPYVVQSYIWLPLSFCFVFLFFPQILSDCHPALQ